MFISLWCTCTPFCKIKTFNWIEFGQRLMLGNKILYQQQTDITRSCQPWTSCARRDRWHTLCNLKTSRFHAVSLYVVERQVVNSCHDVKDEFFTGVERLMICKWINKISTNDGWWMNIHRPTYQKYYYIITHIIIMEMTFLLHLQSIHNKYHQSYIYAIIGVVHNIALK